MLYGVLHHGPGGRDRHARHTGDLEIPYDGEVKNFGKSGIGEITPIPGRDSRLSRAGFTCRRAQGLHATLFTTRGDETPPPALRRLPSYGPKLKAGSPHVGTAQTRIAGNDRGDPGDLASEAGLLKELALGSRRGVLSGIHQSRRRF